MEFGLDKRAQTLQGLAFPLQEEAKRALRQLKQRRINYIQLVSLLVLVKMNVKSEQASGEWKVAWWNCAACVAETGCGERDHWAGSHQTHGDSGAAVQDSHRFPSIPLLRLQAFLPGPPAGGAGSVHADQVLEQPGGYRVVKLQKFEWFSFVLFFCRYQFTFILSQNWTKIQSVNK